MATQSVKHIGFPFASEAPYAVFDGSPLFLFSDLSVHSKNLRSDPHATLLIKSGDTLQQSRLTLMGTVSRLPASRATAAREIYLATHPAAAQWASFGDFHYYSMEIVDRYVVAGFGKAGWAKN